MGSRRGLRSKAVEEFLGQRFDYVVTVCDRARENCPYFPGGGETLHWGFDDPAEAAGSDQDRLAVFERVFGEISMRIGPSSRRSSAGPPPGRWQPLNARRPVSLHLLRHADAGDPAAWDGDDASRPLSEKGIRQAERLGRHLALARFEPDLILSSPKVRAAQTAEIVADALDGRVVIDDRLGAPFELAAVAAMLDEHDAPGARCSSATIPTSARPSASCWGLPRSR